VAIDSHSHCAYGCLYCFSDNLVQHRAGSAGGNVGQTSLGAVERLFAGQPGKERSALQEALRYVRRNAAGYPCAVQVGAISDPCDHIERQQGWLLGLIDLAIKYRQPVRIGTKGTVLREPDYLRALSRAPELFWVAFSILSPDDELMAKIDKRAPLPSERLATMAALRDIGVRTSLRMRPMFPGATDWTPRYPKAYKTLIELAAAAGAYAISYEVGFLPGAMTVDLRERWVRLEGLLGVPLGRIYRGFGRVQACTRPAAAWVEGIMHAVAEEARRCGLVVAVSDPVWKQLGETGCCCGMLPEDPVWGNWQRESATNRLLEARDGAREEIVLADVVPSWAYRKALEGICNPGAGPKGRASRGVTWAQRLRYVWNRPKGERGPLEDFQGALVPVRKDENGDLVYRYVGLRRQHRKASAWHVEEEG